MTTLLAPLQQLVFSLNAHLREHLKVAEDLVVLSPPREPDGSVPVIAGNRLLVFLADVRESRVLRTAMPAPTESHQQPEQPLELLAVCAASFCAAHYAEGLKLLGLTMAYLADAPVLDSASLHIRLSPANLSLAEMQSLWQLHGGIGLPAASYRMLVTEAG